MSNDNKTADDNEATRPDFGQGRYSSEMSRLYDAFVKLFSIPPSVAEKIARQTGSDAGSIFRNATAEIRVSKANKEGLATISDASKVKGVALTNPLKLVRALQWITDAGKNGISYGHTKWALETDLASWVSKLETK